MSFLFQSSFDADGESQELSNDLQSCSIEVNYIDGGWKVNSCVGGSYGAEAGGIVMAGSKKLHKPVVTIAIANTAEEASESSD